RRAVAASRDHGSALKGRGLDHPGGSPGPEGNRRVGLRAGWAAVRRTASGSETVLCREYMRGSRDRKRVTGFSAEWARSRTKGFAVLRRARLSDALPGVSG